MKRDSTSLLGYALLGLIHMKPSSGYDLRKTFAETAMGNYSSSPGAIYPALERLRAEGLIEGTVEETGGLRRRCLYRLTPRGRSALKAWLARPIEPGDVARGGEDVMLRFSFMEPTLGPAACIRFLTTFRAAIAAYLLELEAYLGKNGPQMPRSARLAVESGIGGYRSLHEWTAYALRAYGEVPSGSRSRKLKSAAGGRP